MFDELLQAALNAKTRAYAPYSGYHVGAAIATASGAVFAGSNVENLSYGATVCAERNAIGAMVTAGESRIVEVVVVTDDLGTPCGICLQSLVEFVDDPRNCKVTCVDADGDGTATYMLADLLPYAFNSNKVGRSGSQT